MINTDYTLLGTKLYIPKPRKALVRRIRLIDRLNTGFERKLTLISAPAGFGKTTLLSDWIAQSQLPVAWVSLDSGDNDPVYFIKYIIAALQSIESKFGESALTLLQSPQQLPLDVIIINLIQDIENISDNFVLVFDDYHSIDTGKIHQLVDLLIDRMPPQMHLVIATRVDPNLPLSRLRVRNQLNEFRSSDLGFTLDETVQFFNKVMNLDISIQDIEILETRTEGWIAGLQLAALSIQGRSDISDFIKSFAGDDRLIVDYLAEEVFNFQPENIQNFLLQTSILNRLSEPLCDCVTNQKGSQKMLEELERANLFLVPLDNKRCWYRYHHLFSDLLRQRLYQKKHDIVNQLHLKASKWFEANNLIEEAIEHALASKDFDRAAHLMEVFRMIKWQGGDQVLLFKWLDQLPNEHKLNKPNLGICHAKILLENGQPEAAEKILDRLEKTHITHLKRDRVASNGKLETVENPEIYTLPGRIAAMKAFMASLKGDVEGINKYSRQARTYLSKNDSAWYAIISISSAIAQEIEGDTEAAIDAHVEAVAAAREAGNVYFYLIAQLWLAIVLKNSGQLPAAIEICRQLLNEVNERRLSFNVAVGHVWGIYGEMLYELNELDEARQYAIKGIEFLEKGHDVSHLGWRYSCLAKILCSKQNLTDAEKIAVKMDKLMQTSAIPPWVLMNINAVKARIYLMKGNFRALEKWVNECGLKLDDTLTMLHEAEHIMFARILIAQSRFEDALGMLNRLIAEDEKTGRILNQIETLVLKAMALKKSNNETESMTAVKKALSLAEPGGYIRVFVDEGPAIAELLEKSLNVKSDIPRAFVKKLLSEFKLKKVIHSDEFLVEQLSDRELEVLRFIAAGLSNKKITEQLFISMSTVKTHLRNIYGKLDVHSRTEAIAKAKELGLL